MNSSVIFLQFEKVAEKDVFIIQFKYSVNNTGRGRYK